MSWFTVRRHYQKSADGKRWTKNTVILQIVKELESLSPTQQGNNLIFKGGDSEVKLEFIADNYADEKKVELNATIFFVHDGQDLMWFDVFHLAKIYYDDNYRALSIGRDEGWSGSKLQKECQDFLLPLLRTLLNKETATKLLQEGKIESSDFVFTVPDDADHKIILDNGKAIVEAI